MDEIKRLKRRAWLQLIAHGGLPLEGSSSIAELHFLVQTAQRTGARLIGEIGFNVGFSSYALLSTCPVEIVSFDLCERRSVEAAKRMIDRKFPGRHTLIRGDSRGTVPEYAAMNPEVRFDMIFIDGGHDYDVARADVQNMRALSTPATAVVMDDLTPWRSWGKGPTRAWSEAIDAGVVVEDELFKDGVRVDALEPPGARVWALGHYTSKASL